jgi:hypothetical protein
MAVYENSYRKKRKISREIIQTHHLAIERFDD